MPRNEFHRVLNSQSVEISTIVQPFSCFTYVEEHFQGLESISRIFSLARSLDAETLVKEVIDSAGIIEDENIEIKSLYSDYQPQPIYRLSFWRKRFDDAGYISGLQDDDLIGYAILKHDIVPSLKYDEWHVFESIMRKYPHRHNCTPFSKSFTFQISSKQFSINGLLYCQQNDLNKACAQVALRSLISRLIDDNDVPYSALNNIAATCNVPGWNYGKGLTVIQIREILRAFNIEFRDVDYTLSEEDIHTLPFQKFAYAGIESGGGSLIGFQMKERGIEHSSRQHIIPLYGHTFNKDTWAPNADESYFQIGPQLGYIPSESWTSSFLGHDDNFGSNFCIPRLYIKPEQVKYVVELFPTGFKYSLIQAEVMGLNFLYAIIPQFQQATNPWLKRLIRYTGNQNIILRTSPAKKRDYISHLKTITDYEGNSENPALCDELLNLLPEYLFIIEVSLPQLFPANERKLGEIVLDGSRQLKQDDSIDFSVFQFARLPELFILAKDIDQEGNPTFDIIGSRLKTHTDLIFN